MDSQVFSYSAYCSSVTWVKLSTDEAASIVYQCRYKLIIVGHQLIGASLEKKKKHLICLVLH